MNAFTVFQNYLALKSHFSSRYDFFRYNGKTSASIQAFERRKDKHYFSRLAKHKNPVGYLTANILLERVWIGDFTEAAYLDWSKRRQSFSYVFKSELKELQDDFDSNFNGDYPPILPLYFSHKISLETLTILLDITNVFVYYNHHLKDDVLWPPLGLRAEKYVPFLKIFFNYDRTQFRRYVLDHFGETDVRPQDQ